MAEDRAYARKKIAVNKRVLKGKNILPVALKKAKPCARAFRADCGKDCLLAAIAATTIRAILPFSLRLRECFL